MKSNLRDVLNDLDELMEKSASTPASSGPVRNPIKDDSRNIEKVAATQSLADNLQAGISVLLEKLAMPKEETAKEEEEEEEEKEKEGKKNMNKDKDKKKMDEGDNTSTMSNEEEKSAAAKHNHNYSKEDLTMLNKLANSGALSAYTKEQLLDHELSKEAGYKLALETCANIIEQVGGSFVKSASIQGYHSAIDEVLGAGHMAITQEDYGILKSAADTQIAQSYLDTLVSQGKLTSEGQAVILNSLAQVAEINEETIAQAVAGLEPAQAADASAALMDQFIQRNTDAVPSGDPVMPASQLAPLVSAGGFTSSPTLAPAPLMTYPEGGMAPVPVQGPTGNQEKAAAWDAYAPALIAEAQAFEKLAEENPNLWALIQKNSNGSVLAKQASADPVAEYYTRFLQEKGYKVK